MSKEIDISAIKEGDKVLVEHVVDSVNPCGFWAIDVEGDSIRFNDTQIKQHTPKAFDWAEVKQMDAFISSLGSVVFYYISADPTSERCVIVTNDKAHIGTADLFVMDKENLTRASEYDVKGVGEFEQLRNKLEETYNVLPSIRSAKIFKLAWDFGHSGGDSEIESYYTELLDWL